MASALLGEEHQPIDRTATMPVTAPPEAGTDTEPHGGETVPIPRMEQTARLPSQPPELRWRAVPRRPRDALIVVGALLAVALVLVLALTVFTGRDTPAPGAANGTTLPAPLEDALTRLEDSVRP